MITILGSLPSRNEAENAARAHWSLGRKFKQEWTDFVHYQVRGKKIECPALLVITFYEKNNRRDADNVFSGLKYILDGLVNAEVIPNDSRKFINIAINPIETDKDKPRITIQWQKMTE